MTKYSCFDEVEFKNCVPSCSSDNMSSAFMYRLVDARHLAKIPFVLNSAFRSSDWDKQKGRSGKGYHTLGRAVDLRCENSYARYIIVSSLLAVGFTGIGIGKNFIHVDDRDAKPLLWKY